MGELSQSAVDAIRAAVRRATPSRVWSQGVKLARDDAVSGESMDQSEVVLRVSAPGRAVPLTVVLYIEDDEWDCDCPSSSDTCAHVAAAVIALGQAKKDGKSMPEAGSSAGKVAYRFRRATGGLALDRVIVSPDGSEHKLESTLAALISGNASGPAVSPEQADLNIDRIFGASRALNAKRLENLFTALVDHPGVTLDGQKVEISSDQVYPRAVVEDHRGGARLIVDKDPSITEAIAHGFALCGDTIHPLGEIELTGSKLERLPSIREFRAGELSELQTRILPELARRVEIDNRTRSVPKIVDDIRPRVAIETRQLEHRLEVFATLVYGDEPPNARIDGDRMVHLRGPVPVRDKDAEKRLVFRLRDVLDLLPGRPASFEGRDAIEQFLSRLDRYQGRGIAAGVSPRQKPFELVPRVIIDGDNIDIQFELAPPGTDAGHRPAAGGNPAGKEQHIDAAHVLDAWRNGYGIVLAGDGRQARLPADWLERYGPIISDILAARGDKDELPKLALLDVARLCQELEQPPPPGLAELEPLFRDFDRLPEAALPADLQATLRPYQKVGVSWLAFLRNAGLGAVLADDMGLGKTLQALCAVRGKTLVVCPTSVVHNWFGEIERFRPSLRAQVYHGPKRTLDTDSDVVLTTYAILRLDIEKLVAQPWDMVVLDEAQAIKNPDSQVARAAYRLPAKFRATLSGTPVENRLDELWSQLHFTNPGLLGGRKQFRTRYADPIGRGDPRVAGRLRERIRPFLLRRLKRDVAPELPPRTDAIMCCELDETERTAYEAVRAAAQKDVVARLSEGGSMLAAFEALLRLRQAACHSGLLPGHDAESSSKVAALVDALELVAAGDHKALVFSQWTSLLDLIEPHLQRSGIQWARLDGSTRNRGQVVTSFQEPDGPPVILISLKAGGFGLNLTAADHVFLCDPWWNPAAEDQAADRAHRIGQERPVTVYRLVSKNTVEERILELQAKKRALADAALSDADRAATLTRDDLLALLQ